MTPSARRLGSEASSTRRASRRAVNAVLLLAVASAYVAAWNIGLFVVVVSLPAAALALVVQQRVVELGLARRAAALALAAPDGVADASALERVVAADLAAVSLGDVTAVDDALALAERSIDDPWVRSLACERLMSARQIAADALHPPTPLAVLRRRWVPVIALIALVMAAIGAATWKSELLLAPLALALTTLALSLGEHHRARQLRQLLVDEAASEPARGRVLLPESFVRDAIASLVDGRLRVRRIASQLVDRAADPERDIASRRLSTIGATTSRVSPLERGVAVCSVAAAVLILVARR